MWPWWRGTRVDDIPAPPGLAALYEREWAPLLRLAYLLVGARTVAEDLVQDAFLRLHAAWARVDDPLAYVRTCVVNGARDHHRHRAVVDRTPVPRAEAVVDRPDELGHVLAGLPVRQHAALGLRYHLDLSDEAIAAALGCRPSTVRSLLRRGLARLREELVR